MSFDNEEILDTEKMEVLRVNPTEVETRASYDHSHFKSMFWSLLNITQLNQNAAHLYSFYIPSLCAQNCLSLNISYAITMKSLFCMCDFKSIICIRVHISAWRSGVCLR